MIHIIVAGLGRSAEEFAPAAPNYWTIGVNDIDRYFHPDHLYLCDEPARFKGDRLEFIKATKAKTVWIPQGTVQKWKDLEHSDIRAIQTRKFNVEGSLFDIRQDKLPHFRTSVFAAIGLAYKLGAIRIGVIGMDLLPPHNMSKKAGEINEKLAELSIYLSREDVQLVNLSPIARIHSIPKMPVRFMHTKADLMARGDTEKHDYKGWTRAR